MSEIKVTIFSYEEMKEAENSEEGFRPPSGFYCIDALQNFVFFHYRSRLKAQQMCNEYFNGVHKYNVRPSRTTGSRENVTAK